MNSPIILGKATLYNADCLDVMSDIADGSVDAIICDLPYGTTACKWDTIIPFEPLWAYYKRVIKPNGAIVLFGSQPFTSALILSNIKMFKYELIWDKNKGTQPQLANIQPMKSHENVLVFGRGKITYNPQKTIGDAYIRNNKQSNSDDSLSKGLKPIKQVNEGFRFPKTIHTFPRDFSAQSRVHPTQKPVALMEYLIRTYTNEGDTVLDNTMGSGTTGIACINTNRNFIGMELDKYYFNISIKRVEQSQKQSTLFAPAQPAIQQMQAACF